MNQRSEMKADIRRALASGGNRYGVPQADERLARTLLREIHAEKLSPESPGGERTIT